MKKILTLCLFYFSFLSLNQTFAGSLQNFHPNQVVPVGTKTTDTSSTVSITSGQIQQLIIPFITSIKTSTVVSGSISILNGQSNYLMFEVVNNNDTLTVAVELIVNSSSLIFDKTENLASHTCKKKGSCNSCNYTRNMYDKIISCSCSQTNNYSEIGCDHRLEKINN